MKICAREDYFECFAGSNGGGGRTFRKDDTLDNSGFEVKSAVGSKPIHWPWGELPQFATRSAETDQGKVINKTWRVVSSSLKNKGRTISTDIWVFSSAH